LAAGYFFFARTAAGRRRSGPAMVPCTGDVGDLTVGHFGEREIQVANETPGPK